MLKSWILAAIALAFAPLLSATPSPNNTVILAGSTALITDAAGNTWGIAASSPCTATWAPAGSKSMVTLKGVADPTTCNVIAIAYANGVIWQQNAAKQWYSKATATAAWVGPVAAAPVPANTAVLTWLAPAVNVDGSNITTPVTYNVYQGLTRAEVLVKKGVAGLTLTIAGIPAGPVQCFQISAVESTIEGPLSAEACPGVTLPTPNVPTSVNAVVH